ncbi:hypothetical protein [Sphingobacterium sp. MYb382]|uniref:hypothetical protein n=1 Tax=Sphingobacterium sp. MYb382 TaxID=2745278 RepID=UPI0030AB4AEF
MNKLFKTAAFAVVLAIGFTSCSKDSDNEEPEYAAKVTLKDGETKDLSTVASAKNTVGTINRKGNVYGIRNFRQLTLGQDGKPTTTAEREFFFDFKENDATAATDAMVSFTGYDRAPNLKSNVAKGFTLSYIDKAFDSVLANDQFIAAKDNSLGLNSASVVGWANYSGAPNHQILPVANRTFVIIKDGKALFKFKINSVYSNEKPEKDVQPTNYFFYSVDYKEFK